MEKLRRIFITFGGGAANYRESVERIASQSQKTGVFDEIHALTNEDLQHKPEHKEFWSQFSEFITTNKRGFGYWLWKPYILLHFLKIYRGENVRFYYLDSGCEVGEPNAILKLDTLLNDQEIIFSRTRHAIKPYCKKAVVDFYDEKRLWVEKPMFQTGALVFKHSKIIESFFEDWFQDSSLVWTLTDTTTPALEDEGFLDHRHDQAVFSYILYTKYGSLVGGLKDSELRLAFPFGRVRHGKSNPILKFVMSKGQRTYCSSEVLNLVCSKSSLCSKEGDIQNLLSFKKSGGYGSFSFNTDKDLSSFVEIHFKKKIYVSYLLLENQHEIYSESPMNLTISFFDESISGFREIYKYSGVLGSLKNNSPLMVSFPYAFKSQAFKIEAKFDSPEFFQLRSIIFLN